MRTCVLQHVAVRDCMTEHLHISAERQGNCRTKIMKTDKNRWLGPLGYPI